MIRRDELDAVTQERDAMRAQIERLPLPPDALAIPDEWSGRAEERVTNALRLIVEHNCSDEYCHDCSLWEDDRPIGTRCVPLKDGIIDVGRPPNPDPLAHREDCHYRCVTMLGSSELVCAEESKTDEKEGGAS